MYVAGTHVMHVPASQVCAQTLPAGGKTRETRKKGKGRRGVSFFFSRSLFLFPLCSLSLAFSDFFL